MVETAGQDRYDQVVVQVVGPTGRTQFTQHTDHQYHRQGESLAQEGQYVVVTLEQHTGGQSHGHSAGHGAQQTLGGRESAVQSMVLEVDPEQARGRVSHRDEYGGQDQDTPPEMTGHRQTQYEVPGPRETVYFVGSQNSLELPQVVGVDPGGHPAQTQSEGECHEPRPQTDLQLAGGHEGVDHQEAGASGDVLESSYEVEVLGERVLSSVGEVALESGDQELESHKETGGEQDQGGLRREVLL